MSKTYTLILFLFVLAALAVSLVLIQGRRHQVAMKQTVTPSTIMQPSPTITVNPMATDAPVQQIALTITTPQDGTTVEKPTVIVSGQTVPNADVFIDDAQTVANSRGNYSVTLTLDEGENPIVVVANDANGNYSEKDVTVTYQPE